MAPICSAPPGCRGRRLRMIWRRISAPRRASASSQPFPARFRASPSLPPVCFAAVSLAVCLAAFLETFLAQRPVFPRRAPASARPARALRRERQDSLPRPRACPARRLVSLRQAPASARRRPACRPQQPASLLRLPACLQLQTCPAPLRVFLRQAQPSARRWRACPPQRPAFLRQARASVRRLQACPPRRPASVPSPPQAFSPPPPQASPPLGSQCRLQMSARALGRSSPRTVRSTARRRAERRRSREPTNAWIDTQLVVPRKFQHAFAASL